MIQSTALPVWLGRVLCELTGIKPVYLEVTGRETDAMVDRIYLSDRGTGLQGNIALTVAGFEGPSSLHVSYLLTEGRGPEVVHTFRAQVSADGDISGVRTSRITPRRVLLTDA